MSPRRRGPRRTDRPARFEDALYPTLDLHGMTADEAVSTTRTWLKLRRAEAEPTVRVITGRGLHSAGPPVLPGAVEDLLAELEGTLVRSFETERGGGVYRIRLLDPLPAARVRSNTPTLKHPSLVRQAEEALSELGIKPTPALIDAEIRRIIEERDNQAK